ncbi:MAG TPA: Rnase Y domain-containing protein, partial [bacterium]|nr:Rnase Y domain-containing protein [bacterium]
MEIAIFILAALVSAVAAFLFGQVYATKIAVAKRIREADEEAQQIRKTAQSDAENLKKEKLIEVSDEWYKKRHEFDEQTKSTRIQIKNQQDELLKRERAVEQKGDLLTRKEKDVDQKQQQVQTKLQEVTKKT